MRNGIFWISGFVFMVAIWRVRCARTSPCEFSLLDELLVYNCTDKGLDEVPQDLDVNLNVLDLSYNDRIGSDLNQDSLKKYTKMMRIILEHCVKEPYTSEGKQEDIWETLEANPNAFSKLPNLEEVDLSHTYLAPHFQFDWPPSLTRLFLDDTKSLNINAKNLEKLDSLRARDNKHLEDFPLLHPSAPVRHLDFSGCPMSNLIAVNIHPYCTLKYLGLTSTTYSSLNTPEKYCQCRELEDWITQCEIEGYSLKCESEPGKTECSYQYNNTAWDERYKCLVKHGLAKSNILRILALIGLLLAILLALLLILFWIRRKRTSDSTETQSVEEIGEQEEEELPEQ